MSMEFKFKFEDDIIDDVQYTLAEIDEFESDCTERDAHTVRAVRLILEDILATPAGAREIVWPRLFRALEELGEVAEAYLLEQIIGVLLQAVTELEPRLDAKIQRVIAAIRDSGYSTRDEGLPPLPDDGDYGGAVYVCSVYHSDRKISEVYYDEVHDVAVEISDGGMAEFRV